MAQLADAGWFGRLHRTGLVAESFLSPIIAAVAGFDFGVAGGTAFNGYIGVVSEPLLAEYARFSVLLIPLLALRRLSGRKRGPHGRRRAIEIPFHAGDVFRGIAVVRSETTPGIFRAAGSEAEKAVNVPFEVELRADVVSDRLPKGANLAWCSDLVAEGCFDICAERDKKWRKDFVRWKEMEHYRKRNRRNLNHFFKIFRR
jgi:hypothetical protein